MYKKLFLLINCTLMGPCAARQQDQSLPSAARQQTHSLPRPNFDLMTTPEPQTPQDQQTSHYRNVLSTLRTMLRNAQQSASLLPTFPPERQSQERRALMAYRTDIITQAQRAHDRIAPISVALAREFSRINSRAQSLPTE